MANKDSIADLVIAMAPEMQELKNLRVEVLKLRTENVTRGLTGYSKELSIADLVNSNDSPLQIRIAEGKWHFNLALSDEMHTGGSGYESDVLCLQAAIRHAGDSYKELEQRLEEAEGE